MLEVVDYNPAWPQMFEQEKQRLHTLIGDWVYGAVEHVGSTSVQGLAAKPVIDIMVGVESLALSRNAISVLTENGYCYYPYKTDVMHWFCRPSPDVRTHHLHLVPFESELWKERIKFRDYLRSHPETAMEYAQLKRQLADDCKEDREAYTQGKWPFIQRVLASTI